MTHAFRSFAFLTIALASAIVAETRAQSIVPTFANVQYVADTLVKHRLDVYVPTGVAPHAPTIIHIHGGGWSGGAKGGAMTNCDSMYRNGFVVADINYRLSGDSIFPALIYDCKTAVRFLKLNADAYHIDTNRIGVIGESAGGHLVAFLGTSWYVDSLEGRHLGSGNATSRVHAVFDLFGPTDLTKFIGNYPKSPPDSCAQVLIKDSTSSDPITQLLGCRSWNCPERAAAANPISYIRGTEPPMAIHHGSYDCTVPPLQSQYLYGALRAADGDVTLAFASHIGHGGGYWYTPEFKHSIRSFFETKLSTQQPSGIGSGSRMGSLSLFPNPFREGITVSTPSQIGLICVYDALGRLRERHQMVGDGIDVTIGTRLAPGMYVVEFRGTRGVSRIFVAKSAR